MLEIMEALDEDAKQSTRARRNARKDGAMVQGVKEAYELVGESMSAFLSSITVQMMLDCVRDGESKYVFLSKRLEEESRRLAAKAE